MVHSSCSCRRVLGAAVGFCGLMIFSFFFFFSNSELWVGKQVGRNVSKWTPSTALSKCQDSVPYVVILWENSVAEWNNQTGASASYPVPQLASLV